MNQNPLQDLVNIIRDFIRGNDFQALVIAVLILIITAVVAKILSTILRKMLQSDTSPLPSSSILINVVRVGVWLVGIAIMLAGCFSVNVSGIIAALGVGGIAVSLGLQDTIQNFFGGLSVTLMKIIKPGDHVIIGSTEGIVQDVSWRQTTVRDFKGSIHMIPNSILNSEEVNKITPPGYTFSSFTIPFTGEDLEVQLEAMEQQIKTALQEKGYALRSDPKVLLTSVGQNTIKADVYFALKDKYRIHEATDIVMRAIAANSQGPLSVGPYASIAPAAMQKADLPKPKDESKPKSKPRSKTKAKPETEESEK